MHGLFFFENGERAPVKRLGLIIEPVLAVEFRQNVEASRHLLMLASRQFFLNRDQALIQRLGFRVAALETI